MDPDEVVDQWGRTRRYRRAVWQWKAYRRLTLGAWSNWPDSPVQPLRAGWPFWPARPVTVGGAGGGQAEG
jgi:hypothetical protein